MGEQGFADQLLVDVRAVDVGGVEERDAELDGPLDGGHRLGVAVGSGGGVEAHAPEALIGHDQAL